MGEEPKELLEEQLRIGDEVSIHFTQSESGISGFLEGDGLLEDDVVLSSPPESHFSTVFQLCYRTRVNAADELIEFEKKNAAKMNSLDQDSKDYYNTLKRVRAKEEEMNKRSFTESIGNGLYFGDVVQLKHRRSGKWVCAADQQVASVEQENFKVYLATEASALAWFTMTPAAAFQSPGDPIVDEADVCFTPSETKGASFLHISTTPIVPVGMKQARRNKTPVNEQLELNCSLTPSTFKFMRFCAHLEDPNLLKSGNLIQFMDPQTGGALRLLTKCIKKRILKANQENSSTEGVPQAAILQPAEKDVAVSSNSLWAVEHLEILNGGTFDVSEYLALRHLNTGEYLSLSEAPAQTLTLDDVSSPTKQAKEELLVRGVVIPPSQEKDPHQQHLDAGTQMCCSGLLDHHGQQLTNKHLVILKQKGHNHLLSENKPNSAGVYKMHYSTDPEKALPLVAKRVDEELGIDAFFGLQACQLLEIMSSQLEEKFKDPSFDLSYFASAEAGGDMELIRYLFRKMLCFLIDDPASAAIWNVDANTQHQQLLREQGVTDVLLDFLEVTFKLLEREETGPRFKLDNDQKTHVLETTRHAFTLIRISMVGNPGSQLYVADRFHVLLKYAGNNALANECISLLLDNATIQEQKIGSDEIQEFITMLQHRAYNSSVLDMLKHVCSCHGHAMENNQTEVGETLLNSKEARKTLVGLQESETGKLVLLFPGSQKHESLRSLIDDTKIKFFVSQLYLFAEMCYDRNYIAIALLRKVVSFTSLCDAISDEKLSNDIRSAMVRLATCMYVDCEPQQSQRTKNLSFRWSDLTKQNKTINATLSMKKKKPSKTEASKNFKMLKSTIHNNLNEPQFTEFTEHMVGLLLKLVDFKFYHEDPNELQKVIDIILNRLSEETAKDVAKKDVKKKLAASKAALKREFTVDDIEVKVKPMSLPMKMWYCITHFTDPDLKKKTLRFIDQPAIMLSVIGLVFVAILLPLGLPDTTFAECKETGTEEWSRDCMSRTVFDGYYYGSDEKAEKTECTFGASNVWVGCELQDTVEKMFGMFIFEWATYWIFLIELTTRIWAMNSSVDFFSNPFCMIDFTCVTLDTIVYVLPSLLGPIGKNTKVLRALRLAKLIRLLKVARLMKALRDAMNQQPDTPPWQLAHSYKYPDRTKMQGMLEMVNVLLRAQEIDTRGKLISLVKECQKQHATLQEDNVVKGEMNKALTAIKRVQQHLDEMTHNVARVNVMKQVKNLNSMASTGELLFGHNTEPFAEDMVTNAVGKSAGVKLEANSACNFSETMLRLVMYESRELVQQAIELLMNSCTANKMLIGHLKDVQLLVNPADEQMYEHLMSELDFISSTLDSYELFSGLATADDIKKSDRIKTALVGLERYCMIFEDSVLHYATGGKGCKPNIEVQTMLRHLDAFGAALTWRDSVSVAEVDYDLDDPDSNAEFQNSIAIRALINDFLCAFIFKNEDLQQLAFPHLDVFIEDLSIQQICSSCVISEVLRDNERLIRLAPADLIPSVLNLLERHTNGTRDPNLAEVLYVMIQSGGRDRPIRENQVAIMQLLTRSPNAKDMLFVCNLPDSDQYKHRRDLMDEHNRTHRGIKRSLLAGSPTNGSQSLHPLELVPISSPASGISHGPPSSIPSMSPSSQAAGFNAGAIDVPALPTFAPPTTQAAGFSSGMISVPPLPGSPIFNTLANGQEGGDDSLSAPGKKRQEALDEVNLTGGVHKPSIVDEYNHLSVELQYHVIMLRTLAHCGAGGINIVEANIQSVYKVQEMLRDLAEPGMVTDVKTAIGILWFDIVMDVQVKVPNMSHREDWWKVMKTFPNEIDKLITALLSIEQEGDSIQNPRLADHGLAMRQHFAFVFEYIIPCVTTFYNVYFRLTHESEPFHTMELDTSFRLYNSVSELYSLKLSKPSLTESMRGALMGCAQALRSHCQFDPAPRQLPSMDSYRAAASEALAAAATNKLDSLRGSFSTKADALALTKESLDFANAGTKSLVSLLTGMPKLSNKTIVADLRFEPTLQKLVRHTRSLIQVLDDRKLLDPEHEPTTIWVISLFRTMIESAWGFEVEERDGDDLDGEEADERVDAIQAGLNASGATTLCLDLIARGLSARVKQEAIKLLLALLFREGGATVVQQTIHDHLSKPASALLLEEVRASIEFIEFSHNDVERARKEAYKMTTPEEGEEEEYVHDLDPLHESQNNESMLLLRALQLMCEGHFGPNQDILREQKKTKISINLIDSLTTSFCSIGKHKSSFAVQTSLKVADLILEAIQGPCEHNQAFLASETELIETMNRMLRMECENDIQEDELDDLKVTMLQIFCALLEGQVPDPLKGNQNMIFERILSAVHLEFLTLLVAPPPLPVNADDPDSVEAMLAAQEALEDAELQPKQVQSLVLLQMLKAYSELHGRDFDSKKLEAVGDEVISIEIIWRDTTQKRFFKVPEVCKHLAEATRNQLVGDVNRDNMDAKLEDFVDKAESIMCELDHQDYLKELGIHKIFSRSNQNNATWLTFFINVWINGMYLLFQVKGVKLVPSSSSVLNGLSDYTIPSASWPVEDPASDYLLQKWHFNTHHMWFGNSTLEAEEGVGITRSCYRHTEDPAMEIGGTHGQFIDCINSREDMYFDPGFSVAQFIQALNIIQCSLAAFTLMLFIIVRAPIAYKMTMRATKSRISSFISIFTGSLTLYYMCYLGFAILGAIPTTMGGSPMYNAMLLYDILVKNSTSRDVLLAVYYPIKQLMATAILGIFTVYIFSFVAFLYRAEDFVSKGSRICDSMLGCFQMSLGMGLRAGGGLGEYIYGITDPYNQDKDALSMRFIMDFAFFAFVIIILMNIIFGIIIDTFSELREAKQERIDDTEGTCFICGIDKNIFDSKGGEVYEKHIKKEHNMWAYLKFMILIWKQDRDDDDGLEQFVRMQLDDGNLEWFPAGKALCLDEDHEDEDKVVVSEISTLEESIRAGCQRIRDDNESRSKELTDTVAHLRRKVKMMNAAQGIGSNAGDRKNRRKSQAQRFSVSSPAPPTTRKMSNVDAAGKSPSA